MGKPATIQHAKTDLGQHVRNYTIDQPTDDEFVKGARARLLACLLGTVWNNEVYRQCVGLKDFLKPYTPETLRGGAGRQADTWNTELANALKVDTKVTEFGTYLVGLAKNGKTITIRFGLHADGSVYDYIGVGATPTEKTDADKAAAAAKKAQKKLQAETGEALRVQAAVAAALAAAAKK